MPHIGRVNVMRYMRQEIEDHRDPITGEINDTSLAEDACQHFDAYGPEPDFEIPEKFFEWAFLIAEGDERRRADSVIFPQSLGNIINSFPPDYF